MMMHLPNQKSDTEETEKVSRAGILAKFLTNISSFFSLPKTIPQIILFGSLLRPLQSVSPAFAVISNELQ